MPLRNSAALWLISTLLACGNIWTAAGRSTIPLALDAKIARVEVRHEKHPGRDDVHLIHFFNGRQLHVDAAVAGHLSEGNEIRKAAWSRELVVDGQPIQLTWSTDLRGMCYVMPASLLIISISITALIRVRGYVAPEQVPPLDE